jgi:hypothetical protein
MEGAMSLKLSTQDAGFNKAKYSPRPVGRTAMRQWLVALLLALVSAIPIAVGIYVIVELAAGHIRPETIRHLASPLPVVLHVASATIYATLGPLQFVSAFRRRFPGWHRLVGRLLLVCGLVAGLSGLWMTLFYARLAHTNDLLVIIRIVFSSALIVFITLGFLAILRRNFSLHRAWMMRAYAVGLGAGTQALVFMVAEGVAGPPDQVGKALLMGFSWLINLGVAECAIRREPAAGNSAPLPRTHAATGSGWTI